MLTLILAGGSGSRLNLGEKPLVTIQGRPMIEYVLHAFLAGSCNPVVVLTEETPYTSNWCRAKGIDCITASGEGYLEDIREAVGILEESGPFFTCVADLPCITSAIIRDVEVRYRSSGKEACSVWVPLDISRRSGCHSPYVGTIGGVPACPAGLNILRGDLIGRPQDEVQVLIPDPRLAFNVNTREELALVRSWFEDRAGP